MFRLSRFFPNPSALPDQKKYVVQTFPLSTHSKQPTSAAIERWKHPIRGGQNLTIRYQRLEKSLRGKEAYEQTISNLTDFPRSTSPNRSTPGLAKKNVQTFMGFMVPEEPRPPASDGMSQIILLLFERFSHQSA